MKKIVALLLVLALSVTALSGCGNKQNETGENGRMKITWVPQNDGPVDEDSPIIAELEEKFNVDFEFIYLERSRAKELLNMRIAGGEIPDVMKLSEEVYRSYIDQGILSEIPEELVKEIAPVVYDSTQKYGAENIWTSAKEDGKLYAVPLLDFNGQTHYIPIWREDWLKNVGINKIPETLAEAEDAFYKFVNNDPDGNGKKDTYAFSLHGITAVLCAYGAYPWSTKWMLDDDGKTVIAGCVYPGMKEGLKKLNQYYKDGLIDPEFITGENKGQHFASSVVFWNGRIGFSMPGLWYHVVPPVFEGAPTSANYQNFKEIQGENALMGYGVPLVGPTGKAGSNFWGTFAGDYFAMGRNVGKGSEKMKKILEICEVLNTDWETHEFSKFGRKGIEYADERTHASLIESSQSVSLGLGNNGISYCSNNFEFQQKAVLPEQWAFVEKYGMNTDNYKQIILGSLPSASMYTEILNQKIEENFYAFVTGAKSIDEWDAYVEEINNAGLAQLTAEANEWYQTNR